MRFYVDSGLHNPFLPSESEVSLINKHYYEPSRRKETDFTDDVHHLGNVVLARGLQPKIDEDALGYRSYV